MAGNIDSEPSLKFIGYFPDYLSAFSRTLLRCFGQPLSKQLYTENLVNKNKTKHQTIEHINKGTKKISKHKKKSSAYHGGMSNNFSQYCEERTHQVASIVLRFSPKCDGTN